jgi:hypothetical protein
MGDAVNRFFGGIIGLVSIAIIETGTAFQVCADQPAGLADWSIPLKPCSIPYNKGTAIKRESGEYICAINPPPAYLFLTGPNSEKFVAVLQIYQATPPVLNPEGFEYGPIPSLKNITKEDAEILWGNGASSLPDETTYKLKANTQGNFFIDLLFKDNRLAKYRVRGERLRGQPAWLLVK